MLVADEVQEVDRHCTSTQSIHLHVFTCTEQKTIRYNLHDPIKILVSTSTFKFKKTFVISKNHQISARTYTSAWLFNEQ